MFNERDIVVNAKPKLIIDSYRQLTGCDLWPITVVL